MNCWICGKIADSKEHKLKKSLLKSFFKEEFENKSVLHIKENKQYKLNGPNSNRIKFEKVICQKCNNDKSQDYDISFDIFTKYLIENKNLVNKKRTFNFEDIYGSNFQKSQTDLYKYFVKILGCDLSEHGFSVPKDLINLLDKSNFQTKLIITFSINENIIKNNFNSLLKFGELITTLNNLQTKKEVDTKYRFEMDISYLRINFFYNSYTDIGLGSEWVANKQYIYLGASKQIQSQRI